MVKTPMWTCTWPQPHRSTRWAPNCANERGWQGEVCMASSPVSNMKIIFNKVTEKRTRREQPPRPPRSEHEAAAEPQLVGQCPLLSVLDVVVGLEDDLRDRF